MSPELGQPSTDIGDAIPKVVQLRCDFNWTWADVDQSWLDFRQIRAIRPGRRSDPYHGTPTVQLVVPQTLWVGDLALVFGLGARTLCCDRPARAGRCALGRPCVYVHGRARAQTV